jgi:hypothetical protein
MVGALYISTDWGPYRIRRQWVGFVPISRLPCHRRRGADNHATGEGLKLGGFDAGHQPKTTVPGSLRGHRDAADVGCLF